MKYCTFDLETRKNPAICGWKNYNDMGISIGCIYSSWDDQYTVFGEDELDLCLDRMREAEIITGFNILQFDWPLLIATMRRLGKETEDIQTLMEKSYDPFSCIQVATNQRIPKGWRLDNVARSVLTVFKNGDGTGAPGLWERGEFDTLKEYVKQDVVVESALFKYCREHGTLTNNFLGLSPVTIQLSGMVKLLEKFDWKKEAA